MASHLIQRAEIGQRLQRALHLKSPSPAPQVADVVVPVVLVEDMSKIDDNIQLSDQRPFFGGFAQPASVGNFSLVRLVNVAQAIPSQNKIVVVDRITVNMGGGVNWRIALESPSVGGAIAAFNRDTRYLPLQASTALIDFATPAAGPGTQVEIPNALQMLTECGIVLAPGTDVAVFGSVVNQGITASFWWREFDTIIK